MSNTRDIILAVVLVLIIVGFVVTLYLITKSKNTNHNIHVVPTGCKFNRWGCCPDGVTAKEDPAGTNCHKPIYGGCKATRYGCCADGVTSKRDRYGTNCAENHQNGGCKGTQYGCCSNGITAKRDRYGTNCGDILY